MKHILVYLGSRDVHAVSNFRNDESAELKSEQQPSRRIAGKTDPKISKWFVILVSFLVFVYCLC